MRGLLDFIQGYQDGGLLGAIAGYQSPETKAKLAQLDFAMEDRERQRQAEQAAQRPFRQYVTNPDGLPEGPVGPSKVEQLYGSKVGGLLNAYAAADPKGALGLLGDVTKSQVASQLGGDDPMVVPGLGVTSKNQLRSLLAQDSSLQADPQQTQQRGLLPSYAGGPTLGNEDRALGILAPLPGGPTVQNQIAAMRTVESNNNPNVVSPKGAVGAMQVMPATMRDPGFGLRPADPNDPADVERLGREYAAKMIELYGPAGGAAAYNAGPGRMNRVQAGQAALPQETQDYVRKVGNVLGTPLASNPGLRRGPGGMLLLPEKNAAETAIGKINEDLRQGRITPEQAQAALEKETTNPNDPGRYATLSPEEVKARGYVEGSIVQRDKNGRETVVYQPQAREQKYNNDQLNAASFANRMEASERELDAIQSGKGIDVNGQNVGAGYNPSSPFNRDKIPLVGELVASEGARVYNRAQRDFVTAQLRKESGAAISEGEFRVEAQKYFPQPGDTPAVIELKRQARQRAIQGMKAQSNGAYESMFGKKGDAPKAGESAPQITREAALAELKRRGVPVQ